MPDTSVAIFGAALMLIPANSSRNETTRFGAFELDPIDGELRKHGRPIRLSPQPFKVLSLLVSKPGKLVTREELAHEIWNGTTFVDFEQGLNFCVRRIRAVLDDDAENPRFIETVPRRGYRFIAPVEQVATASIGLDFTTLEDVAKDAEHGSVATQQEKIVRPNRVRLRKGRWIVAAIVTVASCITTFAWFTARTESSPKILRVIAITSDGRQKITDNPNFASPLVTDGARIYFQAAQMVTPFMS